MDEEFFVDHATSECFLLLEYFTFDDIFANLDCKVGERVLCLCGELKSHLHGVCFVILESLHKINHGNCVIHSDHYLEMLERDPCGGGWAVLGVRSNELTPS